MDQIFMTGQQVHCVRHVVLSQRRYASGWTGHDGAIDDVRRVLERTISFGESQSAMVVGSAGSGKRAIVARAVAQLKAASPRVFFPVYLSGSALANDMEGFREIVQQLVPEGGVAGHKAASFFNVYDFLKQLLLEKALAGHAVIFVLDAFDTFVGGAKQLLVYNLLDWMQSKDVCIGLVGISCNFNVLAHFEKRVKSRFSNIQIAVPRPPLKAILQLLWSSFQFRRPAATIACDPTNAPRPIHATGHSVAWPAHVPQPSDDFYDLWEASLYRVLFGADLHSTWWWQHLYDLGKPVDVFVRLLQVALTQLTPSKPLLDNAHVQAAWDVLFPDHVLHALRGLTTREMTLVLGMIGLERQGKSQYSFEMVFHDCSAFYRQHAMKSPPRVELLHALANLLALHVVHEVTHQPQPEYSMVRLAVRPTEVLDAIRKKSVACTALVEQWAMTTLV
ncbi:hypothetical protein, variant 3 [Aphanomyces invadans]|nr:hypothetical protein, variant 3 [Aphanomyces invadans]ETV95862.1 hypothetical protein, variant 3 [Aphanomyces invadans]|eukprot:XP_008875613.1 hypothetical protein, variant 3 [Aphanomyces invadans]